MSFATRNSDSLRLVTDISPNVTGIYTGFSTGTAPGSPGAIGSVSADKLNTGHTLLDCYDYIGPSYTLSVGGFSSDPGQAFLSRLLVYYFSGGGSLDRNLGGSGTSPYANYNYYSGSGIAQWTGAGTLLLMTGASTVARLWLYQ